MINEQNYPEIQPLNAKADKLMVFLHGVGSDGGDLISLVPFIQKSLPEYHFMSPHGTENYDMAPFGRQWFSLQDRTKETIIRLAEKNRPLVEKVIKDKQEELSLTNQDTVLFGFSQGTMMASSLTLNQEEPYHAMLGFSGRLIPPSKLVNSKTPICIIHGADDEIVESNESKKLAEYCKNNNIIYELLIIPNLDHSIDAKGIEFALNFLKKINN